MSGDQSDAALWLLLHRKRPGLVRFAERLGMTRSDSEDAVSEALIRITRYPRLDHTRLDQFAVTVVRRICIDEYRRRVREDAGVQRVPTRHSVQGPEDDLCSAASARAMLRAAARALTRTELMVLCLAVDGLNHLAISRTLDITARASEVALSRARRKLRDGGGAGAGFD